jgi:hypothetical protein
MVAVLAASLYFIQRSLHLFGSSPEALGKYFDFRWIIAGHVAGGMVALLAGPLQLWRGLRSRYLRAHRWTGRAYVAGTTLGAVCALVLASTTALQVNWPYAISLHALATVWLVTGLVAWRTAVQKRLAQHQEWAIRSYIATVAFVAQSLSFEVPFIAGLGPFEETAATIIWLSWTVPMLGYDVLRALRARGN